MTATWETVSCGKHYIRVGAKGTRTRFEVPCNDEVRVSR